jgi:hypothetical protein
MAGWDLPREFVDDARANSPTLGLIVHGSRAVGVAREDSDYDVIRVVTEDEYARRKEADALLERRRPVGSPYVDILYQSPGGLEWHAANPGPWTATYTSARVVLDKTGQVADLVRAIVEAAGQRAYDAVPESYDSYLNSFVRSMKSWRRADELGGRLHAAESALYLVKTLFGLERRWPPYHDMVFAELAEIEAAQGWGEGELGPVLLRLVCTGDPTLQQKLEQRVESLLRERGFEHEWGGDLEPLKALRF